MLNSKHREYYVLVPEWKGLCYKFPICYCREISIHLHYALCRHL